MVAEGHIKQTKKKYYKVTEALIKNQMSNPQLSILWGEGLVGGGICAGKLITSTRKIKIKKNNNNKRFSNTDISNLSSQAAVNQTLNFKNIQTLSPI